MISGTTPYRRYPPFHEECCYTCADYKGDRSGWTDIHATCCSEEVLKFTGGKPLDGTMLAKSTPFIGCRIWRKQHTIETLAKCTIKQLQSEG